jgi:hypothetical protein
LIIETFALYLHITFKNNAMNKEQILELIRSQEQELYKDFRHCQGQYGTDHKHTRYALGAWGAALNLLQTIENNEDTSK